MFSAIHDVQCFFMCFVADGVGVCSGSGDKKIQRLHSRVTRAFGHNIKELTVRLCMKFIKDNPMDVEPMLGVGFS